MSVSQQKTWSEAQDWVNHNKRFIRQIASPYFRFMAGDVEDLYQEAIIVAFKAITTSKQKGKHDQLMPFFRVIFKTNCIKLASGIRTVHCLDDYILPSQDEPEETMLEPQEYEVEQALSAVSERQREICIWLLQQSTPVGTPDIARKFNISRRHACRVVSNSIHKIENTVR